MKPPLLEGVLGWVGLATELPIIFSLVLFSLRWIGAWDELTLSHVEDSPCYVEPLLSPDHLQAVQQAHGVRSVLGRVQLRPLLLRH